MLQSRGVSTIVYSGLLNEQQRISDLDPTIVTIDKTEPAETVIAALGELQSSRSKPTAAASTSVLDRA